MKKITTSFALVFLLNISIGLAQTSDEKNLYDNIKNQPMGARIVGTYTPKNASASTTLTAEEKQLLSKRYIPSIIANTGMAPANFDNIGITLGDDKLNFTKSLGSHLGIKLNADALNGSYTLFKPGQKTYEFSSEFKGTILLPGAKWALLDKKGNPTQQFSSTREDWINISGTISYASLPVFSNDSTYVTRNEPALELLVSINSVFNSLFIKKHKLKRYLVSLGVGIAKINNYKRLDEVTYRPGSYFPTTKAFVENDDPIVGRKGEFKTFTGAIIRASAFKPLLNPFSMSNLSLGFTGNVAAPYTANHIVNANAGIYYSKRHWDVDTDGSATVNFGTFPFTVNMAKKLVEDFSIGLIVDWRNIQDSDASDYKKKNFKVMLSAQIPLKFDK